MNNDNKKTFEDLNQELIDQLAKEFQKEIDKEVLETIRALHPKKPKKCYE